MYQPNVERLLAMLSPHDLVLDVGGWACPFNRAQWVLDMGPYETRGFYRNCGGPAFQGGEKEWFTRETWVERDICERTPWPFQDKQFDFVICSHTLEDIRDPIWVCSELMRVGKRGYIEVPSRVWESCRGIERPGFVGMSHHRWLVEIEGSRVRFLPKYHVIHSHWRLSLPASYLARLGNEQKISWLWWEDSFETSEETIIFVHNQEAELERFVNSIQPYPSWYFRVERAARALLRPATRIVTRLARLCRLVP